LSGSIGATGFESLAGHFESAFIEKNHENICMRKKTAKEGEDPRISRTESNVVSYNLVLPAGVNVSQSDDYKFQVQCARSQLRAEYMWQTRASTADP
jgi:hypothetical protein